MAMWGLMSFVVTAITLFELYQMWLRMVQRGDTCPACDAARAHYRERVKTKEFEMNEILRRGKVE